VAHNPLERYFAPDRFTRSTRSMHFYDGIVVFEKGRVVEPHHEIRGRLSRG
jgi:hypothetical protein